ncbi:hypothetical protein Tco_0528495 [Tanacetum coccineum]
MDIRSHPCHLCEASGPSHLSTIDLYRLEPTHPLPWADHTLLTGSNELTGYVVGPLHRASPCYFHLTVPVLAKKDHGPQIHTQFHMHPKNPLDNPRSKDAKNQQLPCLQPNELLCRDKSNRDFWIFAADSDQLNSRLSSDLVKIPLIHYRFDHRRVKSRRSENRLLCLTKRTMFHGHHVFFGMRRSRPNGKLNYNTIMEMDPYVRQMIPEPCDTIREVPVPETFMTNRCMNSQVAEIKQMEADDQAIQTILLWFPEDIYLS